MSSRRLITSLVLVLGFVTALGVDAARRERPAALVVHYREALRSWFPAGSAASLDEIDLAGSGRANPAALTFVVVDHAVRRFTPMAVDASGNAMQSARLRRVGRIVDTRTARAARTSVALTRAAVEGSSGWGQPPRVAGAIGALRSAELAVVYAAQVTEACGGAPRRGRRAEPPSPTCLAVAEGAMDEASRVASSALAAGADRLSVVEACLHSLRDLARAPAAAAGPGARGAR